MISSIIISLWSAFIWFLPAGIANMMPIVAAVTPGLRLWNAPVDGGMKWRGRRILGDHKTWRGLVVGVASGMITAYIQSVSYPSTIISHEVNPWIFGGLLGFGALGGDMVKSFFKRQMGVDSGKTWIPWDQLDYIIGGILAVILIVEISINLIILTAVVYFLLHLLMSVVGYLFKFKKSPI